MLINLLIMIKNVCVIDTPYALSIYLLKMPIDEIKSTKFFVGDSVNTNIIYRLPHWVLIRNQSAKADWIYMSWLRIYKYLKCWSYPFAKLYAQDHLYIASQMIGPYNYTNIPDGPSCYTIWERCPFQPIKHTLPSIFQIKKWLKYILSRGKMYDLKYGINEQCINRWITTRDDEKSVFIKGKTYEYLDSTKLWENSTNEKRDLIKTVFGISDNLINNTNKIETLILTQPFQEDCGLTDDEMYDIYVPYILNRKFVAIKPHPRDHYNWKEKFPSAYVIETYAPMQLLNYIGIVPKEAITVSSSSISDMPETVRRIVLGTNVNQKIFNTYGDLFNK